MIAVEARETPLSDTPLDTSNEDPRDPWRHRPAYPGQLPGRSVGPGTPPARALPPEARPRGGHGGRLPDPPERCPPPFPAPVPGVVLRERRPQDRRRVGPARRAA